MHKDVEPQHDHEEDLTEVRVTATETYEGPLPHPRILEQYKNVDEDAPALILAEFAREASHRREIELYSVRSIFFQQRLGSMIVYAIVIMALMVTVAAFAFGYPWQGVAIFSITAGGIVGRLVVSKKDS